jgi:hypothetical protein
MARAQREDTRSSHMLIDKAKQLADGQSKNITYSYKVTSFSI